MVDYQMKYFKYKSKYLNLKKLNGGMDTNLTDKPSTNLSSPVEIDPVQEIVEYMLDDVGQKLMGYPRGSYNLSGDFIDNYMFKDVGPSWACNEPIRNLDEKLEDLSEQGMVCIGLISVLLRCVLKDGKKMPSLDPENYGEYKDLLNYSKESSNLRDEKWKGMFSYPIAFGLNDTSDWLYIYTYGGQKNKVKPFSKSEKYPRGTLLFRCFDPYTQGHIAMVYTDKAEYKDVKVFHTIGDPVGKNKVAIEPLSYSHEYFSRGKSYKFDWDKDDKYGVKFYNKNDKDECEPMPYYTHVLLPEDYIDTECFAVPKSNTTT